MSITRSSPVQVAAYSTTYSQAPKLVSTSWSKVSIGPSHVLAIRSNNTLWAWGINTNGQLGDGTTITRSSPVQIGNPGYTWNDISVGLNYSVGLRGDNLLFAWGLNTAGIFGDLNVASGDARSSPNQIGTSSWTQISAGGTHVVAIRSDKKLFTWGLNNVGQLGNGDYVNRSSPVQVGTSSWSIISAGQTHTTAITSDGKLFTWGDNTVGTLGYSTPLSNYYSWTQVAGNTDYTIAIRNDGLLFAWGTNNLGQLGLNDTLNRSSPVQVGSSSWSQVTANAPTGGGPVIAVRSDGTLWSWGYNVTGVLGVGDTAYRSSPTQVGTLNSWSVVSASKSHAIALTTAGDMYAWGLNSNTQLGIIYSWTQISTGLNHGIGIHTDGSLWGWGTQQSGQIGDNTGGTVTRSTPVQIGFSSWSQVATGVYQTYAIDKLGRLFAWGSNANTAIGDGVITATVGARSSPVQIGTGFSWSQVASNQYTAAAIRSDGTLWAWGQNTSYQLGSGDTVQRSQPTQIVTGIWISVSVGINHTVALRNDRTVWAWGTDNYSFGLNTTATIRSQPTQIASNTSSWTFVSAGYDSTFIIDNKNNLYVAGTDTNLYGILGTNSTASTASFTQIPGSWSQVVSQGYYVHGLKSDSTLYAWGLNTNGTLGDGTATNKSSPVLITSATGSFKSVASSGAFNSLVSWSHFIGTNNVLYATGAGSSLGTNDTFTARSNPVQIAHYGSVSSPVQIGSGYSWTKISAGDLNSFAVRNDGPLFAWGLNTGGLLGQGDTIIRSTGAQVGITSWTNVFAHGSSYVHAIRSDNKLYAWGLGTSGQLGNNAITSRSSPVQVDNGTYSYVASYPTTPNVLAIRTDGSLYAWGSKTNMLLSEFSNASYTYSWAQVSVGARHGIGLRNDGRIFTWGANDYGQLGLGDAVNRSSPVQVGSGTDNELWSSIAANSNRTYAVRSDGKLFGWGTDPIQYAITGINAVTSPVAIGNNTSFTSVSAGVSHAVALDTTGSIYGWGDNAYTQVAPPTTNWSIAKDGMYIRDGYLYGINQPYNMYGSGDGSTITRSFPVQIGPYQWSTMSNSIGMHTVAIRSDGSLWSWGSNQSGELGDYNNGSFYRSSMVQIGSSSWSSVSVRRDGAAQFVGSMAIKIDSTLWGWGYNAQGQIGDGTTTNKSSPVQVAGGGSWSMVSKGPSHTVALSTTKLLYAWGLNTSGQLGINDYTSRSSPVQIGTSSWLMVATGDNYSLGIDINNRLFGWGINTVGQLVNTGTFIQTYLTQDVYGSAFFLRNDGVLYGAGYHYINGTLTSTQVPIVITSGTVTKWRQAVIGSPPNGPFAAISYDYNLYTWGFSHTYGEQGNNTNTTANPSPTLVTGGGSWSFVAAGITIMLGVKTNGTLYAWGRNSEGALGDGTTVSRSSPTQIGTDTDWESVYTSLSLSYYTSFAIKNDGRLYAWGYGSYGALGQNNTLSTSSPVQIGGSWLMVHSHVRSAGSAPAIVGIKTDGTLWRWGISPFTTGVNASTVSSPVQIGTDTDWNYITGIVPYGTGSYGADSVFYGYKTNGSLYYWGTLSGGSTLQQQYQFGTSRPASPILLASSTSYNVVSSSILKRSVMGPLALGPNSSTLYGWGENNQGDLGLNDTIGRSSPTLLSVTTYYANLLSPVQIGTSSWSVITSGFSNVTGITTDGKLFTWGASNYGQLGQNDTINRSSPVQVGTSSWTMASGNFRSTYAFTSDGTLYAWGDAQIGEGISSNIYRSSPVQIGNKYDYVIYPRKFSTSTSFNQITAGGYHNLATSTTNKLYSWGRNDFGQLGINSYDTITKVIADGNNTIYTLSQNGALWGWGANSSGQLAQNDTQVVRSFPVQIASDKIWSKIAVSASRVVAIRNDGSLWAWGRNDNGQLGLGDVILRSSPVQIGTSSWSQISAGYLHTAAIKLDGTVWTWGLNSSGQLGDGTTISRSSPVQVSTLTGSFIQVQAGSSTTAAIRSDYNTWIVGDNLYGGLGQNDTITRSNPVQISGSWTSINSSGPTHGIKSDGTLWVWGYNLNFGSLGTNDLISRSSPVQLGTSSWLMVTGINGCPIFAIRSDYTLWAWGPQSAGSFGINDTSITYRSSPVQVGTSFWSSIDMSGAGNNYTTYAINRDNVLFGWGNSSGGYELLYDGSTINRSSPVQLGGMPSRISTISQVGTESWTSISAGTHHSVAIRSDYKLYAWGDNKYYQTGNITPTTILSTGNNTNNNASSYIRSTDKILLAWGPNDVGQLGDNTTVSKSNPTQISANPYATFNKVVKAKVATAGYTLAIDTTGQLYVWGSGAGGKLGLNDTLNRSSPTQVGALTNWSDIAAGPSHALAIKSDGSLWGWGLNTSGQAGTLSWGKVSSGDRHTLAIRSDGQLFGWGKNDSGQVGDNSTVNRSSPVQLGTGSFSQISAGINISAAIRGDGTLYTWGYNNLGQLGLGDFVTRSSPAQVGTSSWSQVSAKDYIAAISNYRLFTWGNNNTYQLGDATTTYRLSPVQVGTSSWLQVSTGNNFASAIRIDGGLFVWGDNTQGQLGTGNTLLRSQPTQLGTSSWSQVSTSNNFNTLAITSDSKLYAWGNNQSSQLGINDNFNRSSPVQVGTSSWSLVSAGNNFSLGLKIDNTLWGWGDTSSGQFGAGTINLLSWTIINNGIGMHSDYTLWAWGDNSLGQLGVNSTVTRSSPVQIGSVSWTVVSSNLSSTMAIKSDGSLWAWGSNTVGQLGFNDTVNRSSPVQLGSSSWTQVSVGISNTTLAITNNGRLFSWGLNSGYQLGLNDTINRSSPVQVGTSSYSQVSAGDSYGLAINTIGKLFAWGNNSVGQVGQTYLTANGKGLYGAGGFYLVGGIAYVWGANGNGQLGLGDTISRSSPVQLGTNSDYWKMIGLGRTIGIKIDGTLWTWGYNAEGELGVNDTIDRSSPVQVGSASNWTFAGDSRYTKWAINSAYELYAWGNNGGSSILADGVINRSNPVQIPGSWIMAKIGSTGSISSSLGIKVDGTLWSWGNNATGLLGQNDTISRSSPVQVTTLTNFVDVAIISTVTGNTAFALGADGKLFAWGNGSYGETGLGTTTTRSSPTQIGTSSWTQIAGIGAPGFSTMIGLTIAGTLFGWGRNTNGMVGDGTIINRSAPTQIAGTWIGIAGSEYIGSSGYTGMAIKSDNTIWSWGINSGTGDNTTIDRSAPVQILSNINPVLVLSPIQIGTSSWTQISAGAGHNMALRTDGGLFTWGLNTAGQLGLTATTNRSSPTQVGTSSFTLVTAGTSISAAIRTDGGLFTWGLNAQGQLGGAGGGAVTASTVNRSSPSQIGTSSWTKVSASNSFMMGVDTTSRLFTWGNNNLGQLGLNDTSNRSSPVQVGTNYQTLFSNPVQLGATSSGGLTGYGLSFNTTPLLANQSSTVLDIGTSDFTIELWFYMNTAGNMDLVDYNWLYITTGYAQPVIYATVRNGKLSVYLQSIGTGSSQALRGPAISTNLWYHMAIVRISGSTSLYVNGTSYGSTTFTDSLTTTYGITFGANINTTDGISIGTPTLPLKGYLTNIRFVVGNGVYTGNFTTPTTQLTSTQSSGTNINAITAGQTKLLTAQSATVIDNSGNSISLTAPWTYALPTITTVVPGGLFTVVNPTITAGELNGAVVSSSGSLYVWGNNAVGQVGDGTTVNKLVVSVVADATLYDNRSSPAQIGTSSWSQIAAGLNYSVAIDINGFLYAWGDNTNGYLGDGTVALSRSPKVISNDYSYTSISSGGSHTVALRTDGTLYAWGLNNAGQLGDNSLTNRSSPVQVNTDIVTSWNQIAAGASHTVGLDSTNIPYAWGLNSSGQLGDNTLTNKSAPVAVTMGIIQNYSIQFSGSSQYLSIANNAVLQFGTSPFTIEAWVYKTSVGSMGIWGKAGGGMDIYLWINNQNTLVFNYGVAGTYPTTFTIGTNTWYHLATVRDSSNNIIIYVNGVSLGVVVNLGSTNLTNTYQFVIGTYQYASSSMYWVGYISNFRVVKGTALYTSGFYPSTIALTNIANTSLLTAQSASIVDNSSNILGITNNGTATVVTNNPFVYYSSYYTGVSSSSSYLYVNQSGSQLSFGTGDFTIEGYYNLSANLNIVRYLWQYNNLGSGGNLILRSNGSGINRYLELISGSTTANNQIIQIPWNSNTSSGPLNVGIWYHIAVVRISGIDTLYINGISQGSGADTVAYNTTSGLYIGNGVINAGSITNPISGYVSNFRIVKGVGVYTGNFSVPTNNLGIKQSAMTNIVALTGTETVLLTCQSSTQVDNSVSPLTISSTIPPVITNTVQPFSAGGYSPAMDNIQAGATNSLGVSNNTLYVWGAGTTGAMGDNTIIGKSIPTSLGLLYSVTERLYSSPVQIAVSSNKSWTSVGAGTGHTLAIATDYTLWGWGNNSNGELGLGTTLARSSPTQIGTSSWSFVNASVNTTHLLRATDRLMFGTGLNSATNFNLGDNSSISRSAPVQLFTGTMTSPLIPIKLNSVSTSSFTQVQVGSAASIIGSDGSLFAWGTNTNGQVGDWTTVSRSSPTQVGGLTVTYVPSPIQVGTSSYSQVTAGFSHTLGITSTGSLFAWGKTPANAQNINYSSPVQVGRQSWLFVSAGNDSSQAIDNTRTLYTWGLNTNYQLGSPNFYLNQVVNSPVAIGTLAIVNTSHTNSAGSGQGGYIKNTNDVYAPVYNQSELVSVYSGPIIDVPSAPTFGTITPTSTTSINVSFNAPASNGGSVITSYTITSSPSNIVTTVNQSTGGTVSITGLAIQTAYTFTIYATNAIGTGTLSSPSASVTTWAQGQVAYTTPGTYSWTAPANVYYVSVVAIGGAGGGYSDTSAPPIGSDYFGASGSGGGGLGWKNNIPVTPGQSYTVVVGNYGTTGSGATKGGKGGDSYFKDTSTVLGGGGSGGGYIGLVSLVTLVGGTYVGDGGGNGGRGGLERTFAYTVAGGGGGAGGYSGDGGEGAGYYSTSTSNGLAGQGGGGGGGASTYNNVTRSYGGNGGGVGIFGQGANGTGALYTGNTSSPGGPGSGGTSATYGGGSGGNTSSLAGGAVRIIWGTGRAFPSTNTGNL